MSERVGKQFATVFPRKTNEMRERSCICQRTSMKFGTSRDASDSSIGRVVVDGSGHVDNDVSDGFSKVENARHEPRLPSTG